MTPPGIAYRCRFPTEMLANGDGHQRGVGGGDAAVRAAAGTSSSRTRSARSAARREVGKRLAEDGAGRRRALRRLRQVRDALREPASDRRLAAEPLRLAGVLRGRREEPQLLLVPERRGVPAQDRARPHQALSKYAQGKRLLEVASAAGFFLAEAKAAGFDAEGVEFSGPMAQYASKRWQVPVTAGSIEEVELDDETYDVIASWGVMTIIRDPRAVMAKFHRALKPGGVWAFNTYDMQSLWGRLFGSKWYILVPNTSQIHNDATLRRLLDEAGFDLVAKRPRPSLRERRAAHLRAAVPSRATESATSSSSGSTS